MWLVVLITSAHAGVFTRKSMHEPWPDRPTQEGFALPKGWMQLGLGVDHKQTGRWRDAEGRLQRHDHGAVWSHSRLWMRFDLGFSRRLGMYVHVPWVRSGLTSDLGTRISTVALGDVHAGVVWQPKPGSTVTTALKLDAKVPSGVEWPHNFVGGPTATEGFLTGTGTNDVGLFSLNRIRFGGGFAARLEGGLVWRIPGIVGYVVEVDGFGNGWLDPGDEIRATAALEGSPTGGLLLEANATVSSRGTYRMGVSGPSVLKLSLAEMPGTAGTFVDVGARVRGRVHENVELRGSASYQALGSDTTVFAGLGLEDFSPQPGLTAAGDVVFRW